MFGKQKETRQALKFTLDHNLVKKKRNERTKGLRKKRKELYLNKKRKEGDFGDGNRERYSNDTKMKLLNLPKYKALLFSESVKDQIRACTFFRELLSVKGKPPLDEVVNSGVVPRIAIFLRSNNSNLIYEALWTITNICSGKKYHLNSFIVQTQNGLSDLISLMNSKYPEVSNQAVWCIGNIAGEGTKYRDYLFKLGVDKNLFALLSSAQQMKQEQVQNITWMISNLCRGTPKPDTKFISKVLNFLSYVLKRTKVNGDLLVDCLWAISFISDGGDKGSIEKILAKDILKVIIAHTYNPNPRILTPALRTIGNIVGGTNEQTQQVIDAKGIPAIRQLMLHKKKTIKKEAVWTMSNFTAGNASQIQSCIEAHVFQPLINILKTGDYDLKKESAWGLSNACNSCTDNQIIFLVKIGTLEVLTKLLTFDDKELILVALEGIKNILQKGEIIAETTKQKNHFLNSFEKIGGYENLDNLLGIDNPDIYNKTREITDEFFNSTETIEDFGTLSFENPIYTSDFDF